MRVQCEYEFEFEKENPLLVTYSEHLICTSAFRFLDAKPTFSTSGRPFGSALSSLPTMPSPPGRGKKAAKITKKLKKNLNFVIFAA